MTFTRMARVGPAEVGLTLLLLVPGMAGCSTQAVGEAAIAAPGDPEPEAIAVNVARPERVARADAWPSSLYVERDVQVTARRSGLIEKVLVERGDRVKVGQPLAPMESDLASHELDLAEQELRLATAEHDRLRPLNEQEIISPQEFLRAEIEKDKAASRAAVARAWLERCTVRAPFDGIVVERRAVVGQRVQEDDLAPLFRLAALEPLRARLDVSEERVGALRVGARATVEAHGGATEHAQVVFISPAVDPVSGTVPVIVELAGRDPAFKLGAAVKVLLDGRHEARAAAVRLPREALRSSAAAEGSETTLLVVDQGRAAARRVQIVQSRAGSILVSGPIGESDRVILGAPDGLSEGALVRVEGEGR